MIHRRNGGRAVMKRITLWICFLLICLVTGNLEPVFGAGKPNVTRHEAKYMENAVNMHIEWQSPNPVTVVKISMPGVAKEISVDPYDNRRNPDGYSGEVDVTLAVSSLSGNFFNYVVQLQDDLRLRSEPVTGQVKVPFPSAATMPGMMPGMMPGAGTMPGTTMPGAVPGATPSGMTVPGMPTSSQGGSPTLFPTDGQGGTLNSAPAQMPGSLPTGEQIPGFVK